MTTAPVNRRTTKSVVQSGRFDPTPLITHRFSLHEISQAYQLFGARSDGVFRDQLLWMKSLKDKPWHKLPSEELLNSSACIYPPPSKGVNA